MGCGRSGSTRRRCSRYDIQGRDALGSLPLRCPTCYPTGMKKTSLYLDEVDLARLRRLARREGRSQAEIMRAALAAYEAQLTADRAFALAGAWEGDGTSVADIPEEDLLRGFGS
jgi:predicted transcriptional regulator